MIRIEEGLSRRQARDHLDYEERNEKNRGTCKAFKDFVAPITTTNRPLFLRKHVNTRQHAGSLELGRI